MPTAYRSSLALVTPETAAPKAAELLESSRQSLGFIPDMYAAMVNSPGLLETYQLGYKRFREESGFTPAEQEVVFLAISFENACDYCMAAHSVLADKGSNLHEHGCSPALSVRTGLCQPPAGVTSGLTSGGPQVLGSYSWTGVPARKTGSTMRQASSA